MLSHLLNLIVLTYEPSFNYCWDCTLVMYSLDLWHHFIPVLQIIFFFCLMIAQIARMTGFETFYSQSSCNTTVVVPGATHCSATVTWLQHHHAYALRMIKHYSWLSVLVQSLLILQIRWTIIFPLVIVDGNFGFCCRCLTWVKLRGMDFYETKDWFIFTSILTHKMSGQGKERSVYSSSKVTHGS